MSDVNVNTTNTTVLCVGDVHIKVSNVPETEQMIKKLEELATKLQPTFIVLLGDVLDRHSTIHVHCLMRCEDLVLSLSKISPVYLLVGNHDRPNNSNFLTNEHPFNAMKFWTNVHIVDRPLEQIVNGMRFIFCPYVPPGRFDEALQKVETRNTNQGSNPDQESYTNPYENTKCVFAHQEIRGAKMGAIISKVGDEWSLDKPMLVSGHIHDYDMLQPNMIYTGTPLMHSFGDTSNKTVSYFTFNSGIQHERIDLGLIKKITHYITPEEINAYTPPEDKLVKLIVRGDEASIKTALKLEKIQDLKKQGVKIAFKITNKTVDVKKYDKMTYRDRLYKEIVEHPEMLKWYNKIFS